MRISFCSSCLFTTDLSPDVPPYTFFCVIPRTSLVISLQWARKEKPSVQMSPPHRRNMQYNYCEAENTAPRRTVETLSCRATAQMAWNATKRHSLATTFSLLKANCGSSSGLESTQASQLLEVLKPYQILFSDVIAMLLSFACHQNCGWQLWSVFRWPK